MDWHRRIPVYAVAALQIQSAWERYGWVDHLRSLGQADRERNAILLQRAWRANVCKRFYKMFRESMQCQGERLRSHLIQPPANDKLTDSGITQSIVFRLGVSSFPFALYYRAGELSRLTKGLVSSSDGTQQQRKETERSAELSEGGWRIVEREKFAGYVRGQIKLKEEARRRRNSGRFASARRRSTNDNVGERRRERLRKIGRMKFKWFYDNEHGDRSPGEPRTNFNSDSDGGSSVGEKIVDGDGELEVLTWLRDLDMGNSHED